MARTVPDPSDPAGFFTSVADKLLRSTFSFGVTNVPVQSNGVFVYSPAVQRLLQLSANIYDATATNFYPAVFRPLFNRDNSGNVFITGYQRVAGVSGVADAQLAEPIEVAALPAGASSNVNVYGVPWIIGAKKGLPNFNQFFMRNDFQVTRRLQVTRSTVEPYQTAPTDTRGDFRTNQMLVMSITNHVGYSFWNSYRSNYAGGDLRIFVRDTMSMSLTNGALTRNLNAVFATNIFIPASAPWPGSAWDLSESPGNRQAAPESFAYGRFDFAFLPESVYQFSVPGFIPTSSNPQFETNLGLSAFPQFGLLTTNWFQAFILDGSNVIDYVQFNALTSSRDLNGEIKDNYTANNPPYQMWFTNAYNLVANPPMPTLGMINQIKVSRSATGAPNPHSWKAPPNMPAGLPQTPAAEASFFNAFFMGPQYTFFANSQVYSNTVLSMQVPYTPTRTTYVFTLWQANDPLVHFLASDLNEVNGSTGIQRYDDPILSPEPIYQSWVTDRYQPWGSGYQMFGLNNVDKNFYNLAYRDPLVWGSDAWNFPGGPGLPITTLGRVHRGTPWQTVFLKATNILNYADNFEPANGLVTWTNWTGNADAADAVLTAPINDWRLAGLLVALFSTNDPAQLQSVNDPNTTDLLNVLNGILVQTNSSADVNYDLAPSFDLFVMSSNSPQALVVAIAIRQARVSQPRQTFNSLGDILSAPEISELSPWLNRSDAYFTDDRIDFGISDEAYEAIPAQLLPRLRPDSIGTIIQTNGERSVQFSGSDAFAYALQASTNLVSWETVSTNFPVQGAFTSPVAPASNSSNRFYRSVLLP